MKPWRISTKPLSSTRRTPMRGTTGVSFTTGSAGHRRLSPISTRPSNSTISTDRPTTTGVLSTSSSERTTRRSRISRRRDGSAYRRRRITSSQKGSRTPNRTGSRLPFPMVITTTRKISPPLSRARKRAGSPRCDWVTATWPTTGSISGPSAKRRWPMTTRITTAPRWAACR